MTQEARIQRHLQDTDTCQNTTTLTRLLHKPENSDTYKTITQPKIQRHLQLHRKSEHNGTYKTITQGRIQRHLQDMFTSQHTTTLTIQLYIIIIIIIIIQAKWSNTY